MNNGFYNGIEELFDSIILFLNKFNKSKILQEEFYAIFKSTVYGNIIQNFFLNLTEENMSEHDISSEEVDNFKSNFSNVLKDVESSLSASNSKIDDKYYKSVIKNIKDKFPDFYNFFEEFEDELGIKELDNYLLEKKQIMKNTGKDESDIEIGIQTRMLEEDIQNSDGLTPNFNLSEDFSSKIVDELMEKTMKLTEWNIWHSHSSFFIEDNYELEDVAYNLVKSDLCPLVFSQDLKVLWKEEGEVKEEYIEILDYERFQVKVPKISNEYLLEGLWEFLKMSHAESNLLKAKYLNSFSFIRCFMNPCRFKSGQRPVILYPQIKLYNNGTFNISLRQISPTFEYPVESFIENEVNIFTNKIDEMEMAPEIMKLSNRFYFHEYSFKFKLYNLFKKNAIFENMDKAIEENTQHVKEGSFSFYFTKAIQEKYEFDDLFQYFRFALLYVINTNKKGKFSFFSKLNYNFGYYWILRPCVYITDFLNQPYRSIKIPEDFGIHLGKIMARKTQPFYMDFTKFLGKNLREFEDYCLYMNNALTLWVFSKSGVDYNKKNDPNMSLIYEKQVQVECIDHLNISLKRMSEISSNFYLSYESVLNNQIKQDNLEEFFMEDISNFGEINNIFEYASNELNWDKLRELIKNKLVTRSQYSITKRDEFYKRLAILVTIIFGFAGASTFFANLIPYFKSCLGFMLKNQNIILSALTISLIILFIRWRTKSIEFRVK